MKGCLEIFLYRIKCIRNLAAISAAPLIYIIPAMAQPSRYTMPGEASARGENNNQVTHSRIEKLIITAKENHSSWPTHSISVCLPPIMTLGDQKQVYKKYPFLYTQPQSPEDKNLWSATQPTLSQRNCFVFTLLS